MVAEGVTDTLPFKYPTGPIPGVMDIDEASVTSQLRIVAPPVVTVPGVAVNNTTAGKAGDVSGGFDAGAGVVGVDGVVVDGVDVDGGLVVVDVDGVVAGVDVDGGCTVIWKQPASPKNRIANTEIITEQILLFT